MQELQQITTDVQAFVTEAKVPAIASRDDYARAGDMVKLAQTKLRNLEDKRLEMTRPLDQSKKLIMDEFRKLTEPIDKFIAEAKGAMITFARAEQARQAEEERKERERIAAEERERARLAEEERKKAEAEGIPDLGEPMHKPVDVPQPAPVAPKVEDIKTQRGSIATATVKSNWQYEIVDAKAVPRDYCEPSRDHIRQAILAGTREIPGIRIYDAGTLAIR